MAAVLGVNLCEAENLGVSERTAQLSLHLVKVLYLLGRKGKSLLLVVFLKILHVLDGLGLDVNGEDVLVQAVVHALQHRVVVGVHGVYGEVLLYTTNALEIHVLRNLNGICTPRGNHLAAWANEITGHALCVNDCGIVVKPT